ASFVMLLFSYYFCYYFSLFLFFFFFQAEDGIRDFHVTGVQTCALPIYRFPRAARRRRPATDHFTPQEGHRDHGENGRHRGRPRRDALHADRRVRVHRPRRATRRDRSVGVAADGAADQPFHDSLPRERPGRDGNGGDDLGRLIAHLHRFYGPAPHPSGDWLQTPIYLLRAYAENLPAIDAIDTLRFITRSRIADAGQMKLTAARQAERRIRRATEDNRKRPADLG